MEPPPAQWPNGHALDKTFLLRAGKVCQGMVHDDLRGRFSVGKKQTKTSKDPPSSTPAEAKEEALARVREDGMALEKCTNKLRGDHEVALAAVQQNGAALRFVHGGLAGKKEFLTEAVRRNPDALDFIRSRELRKEIQRVAAASPLSNGSAGGGSPTSAAVSWLNSGGAAAAAPGADKARPADPHPAAAGAGPRAPYPTVANGYDRGAGLNGTASAAHGGGGGVAYNGGGCAGGGGGGGGFAAQAAAAAAGGAPPQRTPPSTGMRVVVAPFRGASAPGATVLLTLSIGELVEILNRDASGWTYGRKMAQADGPLEGWFPDWCA